MCGEIHPSLAPESSSPRRTRQPDSYVYGHGLVRCAVGIWPSHQRDDTVTAGEGVDVQRDAVTSPRIVTPYRDSVDGTRARVTYQKLVTR